MSNFKAYGEHSYSNDLRRRGGKSETVSALGIAARKSATNYHGIKYQAQYVTQIFNRSDLSTQRFYCVVLIVHTGMRKKKSHKKKKHTRIGLCNQDVTTAISDCFL